MQGSSWRVGLGIAVACSACDEIPSETVGRASTALGADCADAIPLQTFTGTVDYVAVPPYTASGCENASVVRVDSILRSEHSGGGGGANSPWGSKVEFSVVYNHKTYGPCAPSLAAYAFLHDTTNETWIPGKHGTTSAFPVSDNSPCPALSLELDVVSGKDFKFAFAGKNDDQTLVRIRLLP
ncbi:MAG TPA: hypothetical protein VFQ35_02140 [Polyangiaceae bacterium]|nr:hypothetical protein [Polyangiaceae bacterium]